MPEQTIKQGCNEIGWLNDIVGVKGISVVKDHPKAIEDLFRAERLGLTRLAVLLSGSLEAAEDAVQIAFAQLASRWNDVDNPGGYLRQVVVNQIKDLQRTTARRSAILQLTKPMAQPVTLIPEIDETWTLIQTLPWNQQAVVVLRFYEDLPLKEIARILERPESTVRSDLRRALKRLRKAMS